MHYLFFKGKEILRKLIDICHAFAQSYAQVKIWIASISLDDESRSRYPLAATGHEMFNNVGICIL